jgi:hypothetical protein
MTPSAIRNIFKRALIFSACPMLEDKVKESDRNTGQGLALTVVARK